MGVLESSKSGSTFGSSRKSGLDLLKEETTEQDARLPSATTSRSRVLATLLVIPLFNQDGSTGGIDIWCVGTVSKLVVSYRS